MRRACLLLIFASFFLSGPGAVAATKAGDWTLYKIEGRDYVTVENVADFYGLKVLEQSERGFLLKGGVRSLRGQANSVEFFINNLKFNLSYPLVSHAGHLCLSRMDLTKLVEPVMRPGKIKDAEKIDTVVLDPGHGGHDNGAVSGFGYEKNFALDVARRARLLFMQAGYNVVMTRSTDEFIPLEERVRIANAQKNALFISIHFNAGGAGTGLETYTLAPRGVPSMAADGPSITDYTLCPGHQNDAENMALATATHAAMLVRLRMWDRGIKRARFVVIRDIRIPGVLLEGGFLTNAIDARTIATAEYRQNLATSILQAVQNYRRAVGPQPAAPVTQTNPPIISNKPTQPDSPSDAPVVVTPTSP